MANSDSEHFESADEWDDDEKSPNNQTLKCNDKKCDDLRSRGEGDAKIKDVSETFQQKLHIGDSKILESIAETTEQEKPTLKNDKRKDCEEPESKISPINLEGDVSTNELDGWDCEADDISEELLETVENEETEKEQTSLSVECKKEKQGTKDVVPEKDSIPSEKVQEDSSSDNQGSSWSGWGNWGVTSLLSTATESVTTLTSQVSQGLTTVLETGLGVPTPEDLVKQEMEQEKKLQESSSSVCQEAEIQETKSEDHGGLFGLGRVMSGVSSITKLVESAGSKVVTGGLGTLETIGKKTMEVLQDGDPGLRKKRAIFTDKIVLSQVLREAKEKAEEEDKVLKNREEARKAHFETLFDDYQGLVHLEALEMLSKQCDIKLQSVLLNTSSAELVELQQAISDIKEQCQLPDDEEADELGSDGVRLKLAVVGKDLGVHVANDKFIKTWDEIQQWIGECMQIQQNCDEDSGAPTAREIHQKSIDTLARLTAESVEQFHKIAELLLVYEKRQPAKEAQILLEMTTVLSSQISTAASAFSECLNACAENTNNSEAINAHITNVFLEAANSSSYIQEAFQLLIPILQVGVISS